MKYCISITASGIDIVVEDITLKNGRTLTNTNPVLFTVDISITGFSLPRFAHLSNYDYLAMDFYLSNDPILSDDDYNINYNGSTCIRNLLHRGIDDGERMTVTDCEGLY